MNVTRVAGADRSGTAAALAASAVVNNGFSPTRVGVASGRSVDALTAEPMAGKGGYPLLLAGSPTDLGAATRRPGSAGRDGRRGGHRRARRGG